MGTLGSRGCLCWFSGGCFVALSAWLRPPGLNLTGDDRVCSQGDFSGWKVYTSAQCTFHDCVKEMHPTIRLAFLGSSRCSDEGSGKLGRFMRSESCHQKGVGLADSGFRAGT